MPWVYKNHIFTIVLYNCQFFAPRCNTIKIKPENIYHDNGQRSSNLIRQYCVTYFCYDFGRLDNRQQSKIKSSPSSSSDEPSKNASYTSIVLEGLRKSRK